MSLTSYQTAPPRDEFNFYANIFYINLTYKRKFYLIKVIIAKQKFFKYLINRDIFYKFELFALLQKKKKIVNK